MCMQYTREISPSPFHNLNNKSVLFFTNLTFWRGTHFMCMSIIDLLECEQQNISKDRCLMIWSKWLHLTRVFLLLYFEYLFDICRQKILKNYGVIECDPLVLAGMDKSVSWEIYPPPSWSVLTITWSWICPTEL